MIGIVICFLIMCTLKCFVKICIHILFNKVHLNMLLNNVHLNIFVNNEMHLNILSIYAAVNYKWRSHSLYFEAEEKEWIQECLRTLGTPNFTIFFVHFFTCCFQDEKNQIITTNVWLNLVSDILPYLQIRGRKSNLFSSVTNFYKNIYILFGDVVCEIDWHQEWTDSNLKWNSSEYGNVEDIRMPPSALWKPDILMYNRCR